jgi:ribosome biogenesis GTPase / thiamine phosphate phosphatase
MSNRWIGCPVEADYFGEERKSGKQARKLASAKDRSKYKKSDLKQQAKQPKEVIANIEHLQRGRVLSISSQGILVDSEGESILCSLRGLLKKERSHSKNLVTVGDFVLFEKSAEEGVISYIEPRRTLLSRAENLSRRKEQLIAANIEQVLITVSLVSPPLKPSLVDRYIIAAQRGGMEPIIVVNKIDLLESNEIEVQEQEHQKILYAEMLDAYKTMDIPIIAVSSLTGEGIPRLKESMKNKTSVFSGQSGAGKSSLINALTGRSLRIGALVDKTKKGSHTTSTAQLLRLDFGGWCVDTPGIKSFGVWDLNKEEVEQYFPEIFECGHQCRYPDCAHRLEEQCAVKEAVEKGEISHLRYDSYLGLMESISEEHSRR